MVLICANYDLGLLTPQLRPLYLNEYGDRRSGSFQATVTTLVTTTTGWKPEVRNWAVIGHSATLLSGKASELLQCCIERSSRHNVVHRSVHFGDYGL